MDYLTHGGFDQGEWDSRRIFNTILNLGIGAGGTELLRRGKVTEGVGTMTAGPLAKDNLLNLLPTTAKLPGAVDAVRDAANQAAIPAPAPAPPTPAPAQSLFPEMSPGSKALLGVGGAAALGGAGLLAYHIARAAKRYADGEPETERTNQGTLRLTLPTKKPGDRETTVEVPLENLRIPDTIYRKLTRDTKRRLREEVRARTFHRDPMTRKLLSEPTLEEAHNV